MNPQNNNYPPLNNPDDQTNTVLLTPNIKPADQMTKVVKQNSRFFKNTSVLTRLFLFFASISLIMFMTITIIGGEFHELKFKLIFLALLATAVLILLALIWQITKGGATKILLGIAFLLFVGSYVVLYLEDSGVLPIKAYNPFSEAPFPSDELKNLERWFSEPMFNEGAIKDSEGIQTRDIKRQMDITAMHTQLEAYFESNGKGYPVLDDLSNPGWRSQNMNFSDNDETITCDPGSGTSWRCEYVSKPAAKVYSYQTWEKDGLTPCLGLAGSENVCPKYTLTATLEGTIKADDTYVEKSLN